MIFEEWDRDYMLKAEKHSKQNTSQHLWKPEGATLLKLRELKGQWGGEIGRGQIMQGSWATERAWDLR